MTRDSRHVIVCGLSNLGMLVAEQLVTIGVTAVVVDDRAPTALRRRLERRGVRIVPESPHSAEALREADIDTAIAVAACDDLDLANLQTALAAAEEAPATRLVVAIGNAQLGDQIAAAIPTARVVNPAARVGPSFVEACVRSDVVHAFTMAGQPGAGQAGADGAEVFAVVDAVVDEADGFRARYGDLTPVALRRPGVPGAVLCPPRDVPLAPGDHLTVLGRLAEFDARGMTVTGRQDARTFAALAAQAARVDLAAGRGAEAFDADLPGAELAGQERSDRGLVGRLRTLITTVREEFDRPFRFALAVMLSIVVTSTVVLRLTYAANDAAAPRDFGVIDALYLTVETMTTVGYGDYNFGGADHWLQIFGILLMLGGALSVAVIYAFITNVIISRRLERALGRGRAGSVRGHVVLCGLGKVGIATMEGLLRAGRKVVVIERAENNRFLPVARERGVPVVIGDATVPTTLLQAGLGHATAIAALTSDGVANLETVLSARDAYEEFSRARADRAKERAAAERAGGRSYQRRARVEQTAREKGADPGLRVVLRVVEATMSTEVERRFDIHTVRSADALASPYFVGAVLGYDVISTFYVERTPFLVARMVVRPGAALAGPTLAELATGARVLAVTSAGPGHPTGAVVPEQARPETRDTPASTAPRPPASAAPRPPASAAPRGAEAGPRRPQASPNFRPGRHTRLRPGDELVVVGPVTEIVDLIRRNQPVRPDRRVARPAAPVQLPAAGSDFDPGD